MQIQGTLIVRSKETAATGTSDQIMAIYILKQWQCLGEAAESLVQTGSMGECYK